MIKLILLLTLILMSIMAAAFLIIVWIKDTKEVQNDHKN